MSDSLEQPNPNEYVPMVNTDSTGVPELDAYHDKRNKAIAKALRRSLTQGGPIKNGIHAMENAYDIGWEDACGRFTPDLEERDQLRAALAEARQEVEKLKAENDELGLVASATVVGMANGVHAVGKVKELNGVINHLHKELDKSDAELTALRERNARLEEGLKRWAPCSDVNCTDRGHQEFWALLASGSGEGQ